MKIKLSNREWTLLFITTLSIIFLFYWQLYLNPLLNGINRAQLDIINIKLQISNLEMAKTINRELLVKKDELRIYPKDEQTNFVMKFLEKKFRWFGIQLIELRQVPQNDKLAFDINFIASPHQFLGFVNSLSRIKTVLIIDSVSLLQENTKLIIRMKMLTVYQK